MTKRQGSTNYSDAEMQCLQRLVCAYLPKRKPDWELVATAYNSTRKSQWKDRDAASLKRKFRGLSGARMLTNSPQLPHQAKASSGDKCESHQTLDLPKNCQPDAALDGQGADTVAVIQELYLLLKTHRRTARRQQKELQVCVTALTATIRRCIT
ncbi:hypothetical protein JG688_00017187 [Phytophthora aleatoria]|uniref:DUF6818 domain-containing protein n=1 Tax=Phytophthora aleatoria TaxID=2496075 RepID=A0A8J5IXF1_9STRA|nr:hypothetical protein JG688_00017187 [Phytophthora aleatoria]